MSLFLLITTRLRIVHFDTLCFFIKPQRTLRMNDSNRQCISCHQYIPIEENPCHICGEKAFESRITDIGKPIRSVWNWICIILWMVGISAGYSAAARYNFTTGSILMGLITAGAWTIIFGPLTYLTRPKQSKPESDPLDDIITGANPPGAPTSKENIHGLMLKTRSQRSRDFSASTSGLSRHIAIIPMRAWIVIVSAVCILLLAYAFRYEYTDFQNQKIRVNRWTDCTEVFSRTHGWESDDPACN